MTSVNLPGLYDLEFSDVYLLENPTDCCYKVRSDSLDLLPFDDRFHAELADFYRHLSVLSNPSLQASMKVLWPQNVDQSQSQMRLRVTNLVDAIGRTIFYIRRYRQGVDELSRLGVPKPMIDKLLSKELTQGLLMLGGKAGSGKTTLANSIICARLKRWGGVCVTAENPVELDISGRHGTGMCFAHEVANDQEMATAIIHFLRTSPNIIFLGEIRDAFVAKEAVLAALSGHLVITTYHGPSLIGAITRFAGFINDNHLLADALSAVAFLDLSINKDQERLFPAKGQIYSHGDEDEASFNSHSLLNHLPPPHGSKMKNSKQLTIDLLWFLGSEGLALSSLIRSGNFSMLNSEIARQKNLMLSGRS